MNENELIEFYKTLSEWGIIDDTCRGEGEAETIVKIYKRDRLKNNISHSISDSYLFWDEDNKENKWTFTIQASDAHSAYMKAYDTYGPQVEDMAYKRV